jgi:hypothetical protein
MNAIYTTYVAQITVITYATQAGYRRKVQPDDYIPRTQPLTSLRAAWEQAVRLMSAYGVEEAEFTITSRATKIIPRREICNVLRGTRSKLNSPELKAARGALADIYAATQNRQLTEAEDAAARRLISECCRLTQARTGQPLLG